MKFVLSMLVNKKILLLLSLVFSLSTFSAESTSYNEWTKRESAKLPEDLRISFPYFEAQIDHVDELNLSIDQDSSSRNTYINETYDVLAKEFSRCLGVEERLANWFNFAAWASKSAGMVITGEKFEELKRSKKAIFTLAGAIRLIPDKLRQQEIFASTNALIAMEMIPISNEFIKLFCGDSRNDFSKFNEKFDPQLEHEKFLIEAFGLYYQAKYTKSKKEKRELVLIASLKQLLAEQMRINQVLAKVFQVKLKSKKFKKIYQKIVTKEGALTLGQEKILKVDLTKKISTIRIHQDFSSLNLPVTKSFFDQYNVPTKIIPGVDYFQVGTDNWSSLNDRMTFLTGFFWGYAQADSVLESTSKKSSYFDSIEEFKAYFNESPETQLTDIEYVDYLKVKNLLHEVMQIVGENKDMRHRAHLLKEMYEESNENFLFGLGVSHLTLGIDRSSKMAEVLKEKYRNIERFKIVKDLEFWGMNLREINRRVVELLLFSKSFMEFKRDQESSIDYLIEISRFDQKLFSAIMDSSFLFELWEEILEARFSGVLLATEKRMKMVGDFVRWEHQEIIRPGLEKAYRKVRKTLRYFLRHIPGRVFERIFVEPIGLRTSMNLQCFHETNYIRTRNFMDTEERIQRSLEFFKELQKIEFDPNDVCFSDEYYDYKMMPILF